MPIEGDHLKVEARQVKANEVTAENIADKLAESIENADLEMAEQAAAKEAFLKIPKTS